MKMLVGTLLALAMLGSAAQSQEVSLGLDGTLSLVADNAGTSFLVTRFVASVHVTVNGSKLFRYPLAAVKAVDFQGGAGSDYCWVNIAGLDGTFSSGGGWDFLIGSQGGDNAFEADNCYLVANATDSISGSGNFVIYYP